MLYSRKRFEFAFQGGGGGVLSWPLASNTSSHTAGGASCGSPEVFVLHVCGTEIESREIGNKCSL